MLVGMAASNASWWRRSHLTGAVIHAIAIAHAVMLLSRQVVCWLYRTLRLRRHTTAC